MGIHPSIIDIHRLFFGSGSFVHVSALLVSFAAFVVIAVLQFKRRFRGERWFTALLVCALVSLFSTVAGLNIGIYHALDSMGNMYQTLPVSTMYCIAANIFYGLRVGIAILGVEACVLLVLWRLRRRGATAN